MSVLWPRPHRTIHVEAIKSKTRHASFSFFFFFQKTDNSAVFVVTRCYACAESLRGVAWRGLGVERRGDWRWRWRSPVSKLKVVCGGQGSRNTKVCACALAAPCWRVYCAVYLFVCPVIAKE